MLTLILIFALAPLGEKHGSDVGLACGASHSTAHGVLYVAGRSGVKPRYYHHPATLLL